MRAAQRLTAVDLSGALLTDSQAFASICQGVAPSDHEGVFLIPAGASVAPGGFLTFWHASLRGITDQPGNVNYNAMLFLGNLVLNDHGDQITVVRCSGTTPVIVDSLDYSQLGLPEAASNVSIERIDPDGPGRRSAAPAGGSRRCHPAPRIRSAATRPAARRGIDCFFVPSNRDR